MRLEMHGLSWDMQKFNICHIYALKRLVRIQLDYTV